CYRCPFKKHGHSSSACANEYLAELEKTIRGVKKDLAAIFFEPIAGEGGYIVPPREFVRGLRELCDKYNALLVADEVQTGCFRTGKFLAIENFGVKPDIVCLSKAIGGGIPLGATISSSEIMKWPHGAHANTFGGNLLACSAGIATLNLMKKKRLGENASRVGKVMIKKLEEIKDYNEIVGDVRGIGLMLGIEIVKSKKTKERGIEERKEVLCKASEKGLILLSAGMSSIRMSPPLIITKQQAEQGLDIFEDSVKVVNAS
ncbi:MAG: aminotransferase class III-fold pyridoxal phosphate-dependent enzyme, partial [Nanoarchaeota archaeon]